MNIEDQPPPKPRPDKQAVWSLVIADVRNMLQPHSPWSPDFGKPGQDRVMALRDDVVADMEERDKLGRERYGTPLTTHNGRNHLVDAYQEALDFAVYLRAELEERNPDGPRSAIGMIYADHLGSLIRLRNVMQMIENPTRFGAPEVIRRPKK